MEEEVFVRLYNEYMQVVYRYLLSLTLDRHKAEDLTQDVFVKALYKLDFPDKGIKTWLLTVAHNLFVDYVRKNRRLKFPSDEGLALYSKPALDVSQTVEEKESVEAVMLKLRQLPENQRQAVMLCLVNELSYAEAAKIMGVTAAAVANLIYRARQTLRTFKEAQQ